MLALNPSRTALLEMTVRETQLTCVLPREWLVSEQHANRFANVPSGLRHHSSHRKQKETPTRVRLDPASNWRPKIQTRRNLVECLHKGQFLAPRSVGKSLRYKRSSQ